MTLMFSRVCSVAAGLAVSVAAFAQTTGEQPAQPQPRTQTTTPAPQHSGSAGQMVTVAGCIQSEADYRKARTSDEVARQEQGSAWATSSS
jgi:hypothetical protein